MTFRCILVLLVTAGCIAVVTSSAKQSQCLLDLGDLCDILKAKGITKDDFIKPCLQDEEPEEEKIECNPLTKSRLSKMSLIKTFSAQAIYPIDLLVDGNSVFVVARKSKAIVKLDENGNEIARYPIPSEPKYLALHDNRLYVTIEVPNGVLRSNDVREDGELTFTNFLTLDYQPNAIRFTPDGKEFLIGSYQSKIRVYNSETLKVDHVIQAPARTRFIEFSANNNIYVTHTTDTVSVYSKDYELLRELTFGTIAEKFEGLVVQCDGSKMLVSENGKIFFIDANDEEIGSFDNDNPDINYNTLRDIAVTNSGSVFISDIFGDKVYLFQYKD